MSRASSSGALTSGGMNASWAALGVIVLIGALLFYVPGVILALLLFILAVVGRRKTLVVTYSADTATPPAG